MSEPTINADFSTFAVMHTADMDWQASPSPTVWRKRLDLVGPLEASRVTSVVRYDADSKFPEHPHPDGEEIFVLEGGFRDEHGSYRQGSWVRYPPGSGHAPCIEQGCLLYVKKGHLSCR